jgi:hypothetical protein
MNIEQLSTNGFALTDVFDLDFLTELGVLADTFVPTHNWDAYDAPGMPVLLPGANRAVLELKDYQLKEKILNNFFTDRPGTSSIEIWRDTTGYRQELHTDIDYVKNVIIIYLDGTGGKNMGTMYFENNIEYYTEYKKNTGLKLLNSNTIIHGMMGTVENIPVRKVLYINWND